MSFIQEMINEFKQEIQKELAAFDIQPASQVSQPAPAPSQGMPASMGRAPANTGVRITGSSSTKKQRKKAPQKKTTTSPRPQAQTQAQQPQAPPQTQTIAQGQTHHLITNLNPQTARNAIIMAEIIGPPVSRRQQPYDNLIPKMSCQRVPSTTVLSKTAGEAST